MREAATGLLLEVTGTGMARSGWMRELRRRHVFRVAAAYAVRAEGYRVLQAGTAEEGLALAATQTPDLVILDLGLPDREGHEVLAELRHWSAVPVLVLSVRNSEAEKVRALDNGANDYVTKPFGVQEVMARLRALLRDRILAPSSEPGLRYDDGHLMIDQARHEVSLDGAPLTLTRKE